MSTQNVDSPDATPPESPFSAYGVPTTPQPDARAQVDQPNTAVAPAPFIAPPRPSEWPPPQQPINQQPIADKPAVWPPAQPQAVATGAAYTPPPPTTNPYAPTFGQPAPPAMAGYGVPRVPGYPPPGLPPATPQWMPYPPPRKGPRLGPILAVVLVLALMAGGAYAIKTLAFDHKSSKHTPDFAQGPSTAGQPLNADQLNQVILTATDVPVGFTTTTDDSGSDSTVDPATADDIASEMATCMGINPSSLPSDTSLAESTQADFSLGTVDIQSQAKSVASTSSIASDAAMYASPKASGCLSATMQQELPNLAGGTASDYSATVSGRRDGQPTSVIGNIDQVFAVKSDGQSVKVYQSEVILGGEHTESGLTITSIDAPIVPSLLGAMTSKLAGKLKG